MNDSIKRDRAAVRTPPSISVRATLWAMFWKLAVQVHHRATAMAVMIKARTVRTISLLTICYSVDVKKL
jgi:hypothetical protein